MSQPYESKQLKWNLIRKKGKGRYILVFGALLWGVPTALMFLIFSYFFLSNTHHIVFYITSLIIFPIVGIPLGWIQWTINERLFRNK